LQIFDKAYISHEFSLGLAGWGSQSLRAKSSRRAHNPQISSSNLLPAI